MRGYPHDIDAIEGIDGNHALSRTILVERFETEFVNTATADPRKSRLNVAMVVARLYGVAEGRRIAERWGVPVAR